MEEGKKMKCYKRLRYQQFFQVSGLCGRQFLSYWRKRFMHLCRALYGDAILVYRFEAQMAAGNQQKHVEFTFSIKALSTRELACVRINISSTNWNGYTAENQRYSIPIWCHALLKLVSSNCRIFEMKHAAGMETCIKIYFLFIFNST